MENQADLGAYLIIEKALEAGNAQQALQFSKARIKNVPEDPYGPFWLGVSLMLDQRYSEAAVAFNKALTLDAQHFAALAYLIHVKTMTCDWSEIDDLATRLFSATDEDFAQGKFCFVDPSLLQSLSPDIAFQKKLAAARAKFYHETKPTLKLTGYPDNKIEGILNIGYVSPDFGNAAVGMLLREFFSFHDRSKFKIFCYSVKQSSGSYREQIEQHCDEFKDMAFIADFAIAKEIYADHIHILVDLTGYHERARPRIFAMKPAPVQCHFSGYIGTLGAPYIQHHITHAFLVPDAVKEFYTEKLYFMPNIPFATTPFTDIPGEEKTKKDFGLPEDSFVFCCFSELETVDESLFTAWMEILSETSNSVLWLQEGKHLLAEENLRKFAEEQGIEADRIIFAPSENLTAQWEHQVADLWLDTFTLSSRTEIMLALWVGVPILTCPGSLPQSRLAGCYNQSADLDMLIVDSREEYIDRAIKFCQEKNEIKAIKTKLLQRRSDLSCFKIKEYVTHLEDIYQNMWANYIET